MKRLIGIIFTASLLLPGVAFADVADQCDSHGSTQPLALCYCTAPVFEDLGNVTSSETCKTLCEAHHGGGVDGSVSYQLQCDINGVRQTFAFGSSTELQQQADAFAAEQAATQEAKEAQPPILNVQIPGLKLSNPEKNGEFYFVNYIGEYIAALYAWLIGAASLAAVVLIMVGGLQWIIAGGNAAGVERAKQRIANAVTGLVLLLAAYTIAFIIDPNTVQFKTLKLQIVDQILFTETSGFEGSSGGGDAASCAEALANAKAVGSCAIEGGMDSPIDPTNANSFACNYHLKDNDYNFSKVKSLDYPATFGNPIYAPFDGVVYYTKGEENVSLCGNHVRLVGASGGNITICHMQNFVDANGNALTTGTLVTRGQVIGHIGGACCSGQTPPSDWRSAKENWCTAGGTACTDPTKNESCSCQNWQQAGNTSGPHVHVTMNSGGNILTCQNQ